jgi:hypothetical protein
MSNLENRLRQLQQGELTEEEALDVQEEGNRAIIEHEHNGHNGRDAKAFKNWYDSEADNDSRD